MGFAERILIGGRLFPKAGRYMYRQCRLCFGQQGRILGSQRLERRPAWLREPVLSSHRLQNPPHLKGDGERGFNRALFEVLQLFKNKGSNFG